MNTRVPPDTDSSRALAEAIRHYQSQGKFAKLLGITQQRVWNCLHRGWMDAELAVLIEEKTEGLFPRWKFRPDLWDAPADAASIQNEAAA